MAAVIKRDACRLQPVSVSALRERSTFAMGKVIEAEVMERMRVQREARIARQRAAFANACDPVSGTRACRGAGRRRSEGPSPWVARASARAVDHRGTDLDPLGARADRRE
jgi:hypothetical protein